MLSKQTLQVTSEDEIPEYQEPLHYEKGISLALSPFCCLPLSCVVSLLLQGRIRARLKTREPEAGSRSSTLTLRYTGGEPHLGIHRTSFFKGSFQNIVSKCDIALGI